MAGRELDQYTLGCDPTDEQVLRRAAVHVADQVAAQHPHPLDDVMPKLAGRQLATDPTARAELLLLLDVIGYPTNRRPA